MKEEFREVAGWPRYLVSNLGRLFRRSYCDGQGELVPARFVKVYDGDVALFNDVRRKDESLAGIVLFAFVGPPPSEEENMARHLDDNRMNNCLDNLAWGSHRDNMNDAKRNGRYARSEEFCQMLSRVHKGKTISPEQRAKISKAGLGNKRRLGKVLSPEHKAKISASQKGKPKSAESNAKRSASQKGRPKKRLKFPPDRLIML